MLAALVDCSASAVASAAVEDTIAANSSLRASMSVLPSPIGDTDTIEGGSSGLLDLA